MSELSTNFTALSARLEKRKQKTIVTSQFIFALQADDRGEGTGR